MVAGTEELCVACVGNPNAGKSTLFNAITGGQQRIGNWPGTTVERRQGQARAGATCLSLVDLPGIYSLMAQSSDQEIALDFLFQDHPDVLVNIVDASNLERNLYLTVQLLESGCPVVVALNMMDIATRRGIGIDQDTLASGLGVSVVPTIATRHWGTAEVAEQVASSEHELTEWQLDYGHDADRSSLRSACD